MSMSKHITFNEPTFTSITYTQLERLNVLPWGVAEKKEVFAAVDG